MLKRHYQSAKETLKKFYNNTCEELKRHHQSASIILTLIKCSQSTLMVSFYPFASVSETLLLVPITSLWRLFNTSAIVAKKEYSENTQIIRSETLPLYLF